MRKSYEYLAGIALLVTSCMGGGATEKESLVEQVRLYHDALRWRRFDEAAAQLRPEQRMRFLDALRPVRDDIEVTDFEVTRAEPQASGTRVQISVEWQSKRTGTVQKTELAEQWQRVGSTWLLAETRLLGGEPLPLLRGLTEPPSRATIGEGTPQP